MPILRAALRGRLHLWLWLAGLVFLLTGTAARAQTVCDDALREAQKSYDLGLFEDVPGQLAPCLGAKTSRPTAVQVHSLLARTYLAADDLKKAREEVSTILRLDSSFEAGSPPRFAELVVQVRREEQTVQVTSVSKTKESLREAPATVAVITSEEIERRGYTDLEQLLHDLPGFDISRTNGDIYSVIYQRGYRSPQSDRDLLLLDGLEQNDLSTNVLYLSPQYSLANIDRVEVIYGPASTMYGANAYTGVISVITKEPEALIPEGKKLGYQVQAGYGGYDTRYSDVTLAGGDGTGNLAWSLAGRYYESGQRDLSHLSDWDFTFNSIDYKSLLRLSGADAENFNSKYPCANNTSPYYACHFNDQGRLVSIDLTDAGERLVRGLDRKLIEDNHFRFDDRTQDWSLYGKLKISNLTFGFETWTRQEGIASAVKAVFNSGISNWTPRQTFLYLKYSQPVARDLTFNAFTRYQQSGLERQDSRYIYTLTYAGAALNIWSLVSPCITPANPMPLGCPPALPTFQDVSFGDLSSQIRSELNLVYEPLDKVSAVGGIEFSKASIQTQYDQLATGPGGIIATPSSQQTEHTDLALYTQVSYKPRQALKLALAGRLSYNEINNRPGAYGFGTLFSPRAAVIYTPLGGRLALKAIYSEAFKDPPDNQKFGTLRYVNEYPSNGLQPERVSNWELSAGWQPADSFSLEGSAYEAHYTDVVSFRSAGCDQLGCLQYANRDEFRIRGLQLQARYRWRSTEIWGNYTYTEPFQIKPRDLQGNPLTDDNGQVIDRLRIGDIARQRLNLGVSVNWRQRLKTDLRLSFVGTRKTGAGTTVPENPFTQIDPYTVADFTLSYTDIIPGSTLQLVVNNLFDKNYYDPGVEFQIGVPRVLQPGRVVYLRVLSTRFLAKGRDTRE
jgi:outer membrane receptor for ferrienterochelin and colicins